MKTTPHNWKEARGLQAWRLKQRGWSQRQIAEALGVSEGAVSQWMTRARQAGPEALRRRLPPGAPRRLPAEQLTRLPALLRRGPAAYGFRGDLWPRTRIAAVIRLEFGVSYHPTHVGRLCNQIRWSPQKPTRRARQRDEAAIAQWRDETWPALKRGRKPKRKRSSS
jgi:transposase